MAIEVFYSSVSGNLQIKKNQQSIFLILDSKQLEYAKLDVAADEAAKDRMRDGSGKALVPQIFVNGKFKGGFEEFDEAKESGQLNEFLELEGVF